MFKHITSIKSFGIFSDFSGGALPDFRPFNLIYGWNYSGKTTLSRVFRSIETQVLYPDFAGSKFSILGSDGDVFDENFVTSTKVRVYNEDFRKEHLFWDEKDGFYPILLLGAENIELWDQLEKETAAQVVLEAKNAQLVDRIDANQKVIDKAETQCAGRIAKELPVGRFDRRHLRPLIMAWQSVLPEPLTSQQVQLAMEKLAAEEKDILPRIVVESTAVESLWDDALKLLQEQILAAVPIPHLIDNPLVAAWVAEGQKIHEGKDQCEFCENDLGQARINALSGHFSDAFDKMKRRLEQVTAALRAEKMSSLEGKYPKSCFYKDMQPQHDGAIVSISNAIAEFNACLDTMIAALSKKIENPFSTIAHPEARADRNKIFSGASLLQELIDANNLRTASFAEQREDAIEVLKSHYAGEEMRSVDRFGLEGEIEKMGTEQKLIQSELRESEASVFALRAKLSNAANGAESINSVLRSFFGKDDIRIEVTENDRFLLMRGTEAATNLSEGEKTAIAFCYFITKLIEDGQKLSDLIVYIDDPMSSLDANHTLHLTAFIKNTFYKFDPAAPNPNKHRCLVKQLFISTHSHEFFHLMFDWMSKMKDPMYHAWMVERIDTEDTSKARLVECPDSIKKYRSEYLFLFHQLCEFTDHPQEDAQIIFNIGNMARRFIEGYAAFKFMEYSNIDTSLDRLITDPLAAERARKFMHLYSHTLSRGGGLRLPDMGEANEVVSLILAAVREQDPIHYGSLEATL